MDHKTNLLKAISVICTDEAVTDTLWMPDNISVTVAEALCEIAFHLGATDEQLDQALKGPVMEDGHGRPSGEA